MGRNKIIMDSSAMEEGEENNLTKGIRKGKLDLERDFFLFFMLDNITAANLQLFSKKITPFMRRQYNKKKASFLCIFLRTR